MELSQILMTLWKRKPALLVVLALAVLAAMMAQGRKQAAPTGAATAQILVDSPQSALGNLKQNTVPLSTRAGVFAQFMASSAVRDAVAKVTGLPASQIFSQGPFDNPAAAPTGTTAPPPDTSSLAAGKRYRLNFVSQEDLPLVTVYAQAPTPREAQLLANGVSKGVQDYVDRLQAEGKLKPQQRVVIRSLGAAEGGTVAAGASPALSILAFVGVFVFGCLLILAVTSAISARRRRKVVGRFDAGTIVAPPSEEDADAEPADQPEPVGPRTPAGIR